MPTPTDRKISELNAAGPITGTEILPVDQGGRTVKTPLSAIFTALGGGTGGAQNFLGLSDTPAAYTPDGHQILRVNLAEDSVEFTDTINAGSF